MSCAVQQRPAEDSDTFDLKEVQGTCQAEERSRATAF